MILSASILKIIVKIVRELIKQKGDQDEIKRTPIIEGIFINYSNDHFEI